MKKLKKLNKRLIIICAVFLHASLFSQTKEELKKQKSELEKEIKYTTQLLEKTKKNKDKSLNYLKFLTNQIKNREDFLTTLNIEVSILNRQIKKTETRIFKNKELIKLEEKTLQRLKKEYAKMIYAARKQKARRNQLMFIVSSSDFNQAYKRIIFLKQYSAFRKNQAVKIKESQIILVKNKEILNQEKEKLLEDSAAKKSLINSRKNELVKVQNTKQEKQTLINKLSKSERLFKNRLQEKQKKAKKLDEKIRKIIEEEIRKAREEAKKKNGDFNLTPEALALSSEFARNKGKLPWPLEKGIIVSRYGKQKHAVFSDLETYNNGIDIATDKNAIVRAVFDGKVSRIFFIKGQGKAVLINHGEYFSVYSGLKDLSVKAGDKLLAKEKIGLVITNEEENKTELHFEIWKGYDKHNPSNWLYKAY